MASSQVISKKTIDGPREGTNTPLSARYRALDISLERDVNLSLIEGEEISKEFAATYFERAGLLSLLTPPQILARELVQQFSQNLFFPNSDLVCSYVHDMLVEFTSEEINNYLGFPNEAPEEMTEAEFQGNCLIIQAVLGYASRHGKKCTEKRDEPERLWIVDHILKFNLFPVGHKSQRSGNFQQVLFAIESEQWFNVGKMVISELHHGLENRSTERSKEVALPLGRTVTGLLRAKYGAYFDPAIFRACTAAFTLEQVRKSRSNLPSAKKKRASTSQAAEEEPEVHPQQEYYEARLPYVNFTPIQNRALVQRQDGMMRHNASMYDFFTHMYAHPEDHSHAYNVRAQMDERYERGAFVMPFPEHEVPYIGQDYGRVGAPPPPPADMPDDPASFD